MEYLAAIYQEDGPGFGVVFPDFPGCVSHGDTLEESKNAAREALQLHLEGMLEDGETIPRPMSLDAARADELCAGAEAFVYISASVQSPSIRINVTLPADELKRIDDYANGHGYTRSGLLLLGAKKIMSTKRS